MRKSRFVKTAGSLVVIMLIVLASADNYICPDTATGPTEVLKRR